MQVLKDSPILVLDEATSNVDTANEKLIQKGLEKLMKNRTTLIIARALLKDSPVLLMDEAVSNLDVENERAVQKAVAQLQKGRTTLVIAHRLSTIRTADKIVVLEKGRVAEIGTHEELIKRRGVYSHLIATQNIN